MKKKLYTLIWVIALIFVDRSILFTYAQKSVVKLLVFGLFPLMILIKNKEPLPNLRKDKYLKWILLLCVGIIITTFMVAYGLSELGLLNNVKASLANHGRVSKANYPFISLYILFVNGPMEEFFFRHFIYQIKWKHDKLMSSFFFSFYHVGMLYTMVSLPLFLLALLGLVFVGYLFILFNTTKYSILNSVLLHMAANLAINIVGWLIVMKH